LRLSISPSQSWPYSALEGSLCGPVFRPSQALLQQRLETLTIETARRETLELGTQNRQH
jgi:hypothetical protein